MTQHTQGPWRYEQRGTQIWGRSVGGGRLEESDHLVADVRGWGHIQYLPNGKDVQDANGRLIAAAPDLHEQLENCVDLLAACFPHAPVDSCIGDAIAKGNAALTKATGAA